jgi:colanic acid biosynthesis glycosyl transferase WcaI
VELLMYRRASHISVIAPAFKRSIVDKGVPDSKVSTIPNFVDTEFIRPLPRHNDFSRAHGLDGVFVVSHCGNLGYVYDLETMLGAARQLRSRGDILFLIVGDGVAKETLMHRARELRLENVRFMPFQTREQLPWLRASTDVQVSLYKSGAARYSMPSKVYEIMASGRPILASAEKGSDVRSLIETAGCGLCVEPGDPGGLAQAVEALREDLALREDMGRKGRAWAEERCERRVAALAYSRLFDQLATSSA